MLSGKISKHVENLTGKFGQSGDDRLLLMAGLLVTDELWETRKQLDELSAKLAQIHEERATADQVVESAQAEFAGMIDAAAERIQALSARLAQSGSKG